jgi:hypothetical protein
MITGYRINHLIVICLLTINGGGAMALTNLKLVSADHPLILYHGRWDQTDPKNPRHSWPGISLEFSFTGTAIGIRMADAVNYYNVYIDSQLIQILHGKSPELTDYILAENLPDTVHTLKFSKRNASFDQVFSISGFWIDEYANLLKTPDSTRYKIEFLGNSFTAAEGNEATEPEMEWNAKMEVTNIDQGFGPIIAQHLNAQYTTTCRPGIGMACDWQGNREMVLSKRFDRSLMDFEWPKWHFEQWIPDLVVIILGLNDYSGFGGWQHPVSQEDSKYFQICYHDFIEKIRGVYPNVRILAVAAHVPWIREQVSQIVQDERAGSHQDIWYTQFDELPGGYVANGHPTVQTHHKIAEQIIQAIEDNSILEE